MNSSTNTWTLVYILNLAFCLDPALLQSFRGERSIFVVLSHYFSMLMVFIIKENDTLTWMKNHNLHHNRQLIDFVFLHLTTHISSFLFYVNVNWQSFEWKHHFLPGDRFDWNIIQIHFQILKVINNLLSRFSFLGGRGVFYFFVFILKIIQTF